MNINPRTLRYVLTVSEERSFSRAAEKLYISQPSLSQHIKRAEEEAGAPFFNRNIIPLTLTYTGERYIAAARDFFALENRLGRELEDITQSRLGRIVVGVSATRSPYIVPWLFKEFKKEYPSIELASKEGPNDYLLELVHGGKIDFAFVGYADQNLTSIRLGDDRLLFAVPRDNPIACDYISHNKKSVNLNDFREEPFILLRKGQAIRNTTDRIFSDCGISPHIAYETSSFDTAYRMARTGLGCTFVPSVLHPLFEEVVSFDINSGSYLYPLLLVYNKDAYLSEAMRHFVDISKSLYSAITGPSHNSGKGYDDSEKNGNRS